VSDEHGPAAFVQIALGERERLVDPQAGAPEHDDHSAQAIAVVVSPAWRITATISSTRGGSAG